MCKFKVDGNICCAAHINHQIYNNEINYIKLLYHTQSGYRHIYKPNPYCANNKTLIRRCHSIHLKQLTDRHELMKTSHHKKWLLNYEGLSVFYILWSISQLQHVQNSKHLHYNHYEDNWT